MSFTNPASYLASSLFALAACAPTTIGQGAGESAWTRTEDGLLIRGPGTHGWEEQLRRDVGLVDIDRHTAGMVRLTRVDRRSDPRSGEVIEIVDQGDGRLLVREIDLSIAPGPLWSANPARRRSIDGRFDELSRGLVRLLAADEDLARTQSRPGEIRVCDHPPRVLIEVKVEGDLPLLVSRFANCRGDDSVRAVEKRIEHLLTTAA